MDSNTRIIFYDLETTGLSPEEDAIIEIGAIDNYGNEFDKLINPNKEISSHIEKLTGITNSKLKYRNNMKQSYNVIKEWFNFDNKNIYLIAHNGDRFDYKFLSKVFNIKHRCIDTLLLFKKLLPFKKSYSIKSLCEIYNIDCSKHHRALEDVIILKQLYEKAIKLYCELYRKKNVSIEEIYYFIYE